MTNKQFLSIIIILILNSCGSNENKTNDTNNIELMKNKDKLRIIKHKKKSLCESKEYYNQVAENSPEYRNLIIHARKEYITCGTYRNVCSSIEGDDPDSQFNCIIGGDRVSSDADAKEWYNLWFYHDAYQSQWDDWYKYLAEHDEEEMDKEQLAYAQEQYNRGLAIQLEYDQQLGYQQLYYPYLYSD